MMVSRNEDPLTNPTAATTDSAIEGQFDDPVETPVPRGVRVGSKELQNTNTTQTKPHQPIVNPAIMMRPIFYPGLPIGMQPIMIHPAQYVLVPPHPSTMAFPQYAAPYSSVPTPQLLAATPIASGTPSTEWHIPMSHNYHPSASNANTDIAPEIKSLDIQSPPNPVAESNPMFDDGESFPVIPEDLHHAFPIDFNEINPVDVLCGRGGGTNVHPGNIHFRKLVDYYRRSYGIAKKVYKSNIAKTIVKAIRQRHGRFLKKGDNDELYYEIGDIRAKEKTSQTLREGLSRLSVDRQQDDETTNASEKDYPEEPNNKRQKTGELTAE